MKCNVTLQDVSRTLFAQVMWVCRSLAQLPCIFFSVEWGSSPNLCRVAAVHKAPHFPGSFVRSNLAATVEKNLAGGPDAAFFSLSYLHSWSWWGRGVVLKLFLPPRTIYICFKNVCFGVVEVENELYLSLIQNNSLESYLWGGGRRPNLLGKCLLGAVYIFNFLIKTQSLNNLRPTPD